jgi:hypothetical protein
MSIPEFWDLVPRKDYDALAALLMSTYACCCRECANKIRAALPEQCAAHDECRTPDSAAERPIDVKGCSAVTEYVAAGDSA